MKLIKISYRPLAALLLMLLSFSCVQHPLGAPFSKWAKDKKKNKDPLYAPANMLYIPGGEFIMGDLDKGTSADKNTLPHQQEVESFYIDKTEVTNLSYVMYLKWLQKNASELDVEFALPDTQCWYNPIAYNEPMVRNYLRHPSFNYYPVVGVSWNQAAKYCEWRSERINALDSTSEEEVEIRLPTEAEWEYAALTNYNYNSLTLSNDRYFSIRQAYGFGRGMMMHNFQRGRGDLQGLNHRPNDAAQIPAPVYMYEPNEYGLYNMYGNVSEWVGDVYFPFTVEDIEQAGVSEEVDELADSIKNDPTYVDPNETFNKLLDSFNIKDVVRETEVNTDFNNEVLRVYKGASFVDRAYYLNPGARRYLPQNVGSHSIGFRCAASVDDDKKAEKREKTELGAGATDSTEKTKRGFLGLGKRRKERKAKNDSLEVSDESQEVKASDKNKADESDNQDEKPKKEKKEKKVKEKKEKPPKEKKEKKSKEKEVPKIEEEEEEDDG